MDSYIIYYIVYFFALLFYLLIKGRIGFALFLIILFFFAALRGDVGNDTCGYQNMYNHFNLDKNRLHLGRIEPLFASINIFLNFIGLGYQSIFITVAAIQSLIYFKIYQYVDRKNRWILVFLILIYYFSLQINTIRYGLSVIIFSLAFIFYLNGKYKLSVFVGIMSVGIHVAAAPLFLLLRRHVVKYVFILFITLFLYDYFFDKGLVLAKLSYIKQLVNWDLNFSSNIAWFILRNVSFLMIIFWLVKDNFYKYLFLFFVIGIGILEKFMPVIGRFSEAYVFMLIIYLLHVGVKKEKLLFLIPFILLSLYSGIVYPLLKGDKVLSEARKTSTKLTNNNSGVSYHFFFEDDYLVCK
jgi:hypothetical protein